MFGKWSRILWVSSSGTRMMKKKNELPASRRTNLMYNYLWFGRQQCCWIRGYILLGAQRVNLSTLQFSGHVAFRWPMCYETRQMSLSNTFILSNQKLVCPGSLSSMWQSMIYEFQQSSHKTNGPFIASKRKPNVDVKDAKIGTCHG